MLTEAVPIHTHTHTHTQVSSGLKGCPSRSLADSSTDKDNVYPTFVLETTRVLTKNPKKPCSISGKDILHAEGHEWILRPIRFGNKTCLPRNGPIVEKQSNQILTTTDDITACVANSSRDHGARRQPLRPNVKLGI